MQYLTILSTLLAVASATSYDKRSTKRAGPSNLARDAATLAAFAKTVTSDPKGIVKTWVGTDPCKFKGIHCTKRPDGVLAVAGVNINGVSVLKTVREGRLCLPLLQANLKGNLKLTNLVEKLTDITVFHANSNEFTGEFPDVSDMKYFFEIGQLSSLSA